MAIEKQTTKELERIRKCQFGAGVFCLIVSGLNFWLAIQLTSVWVVNVMVGLVTLIVGIMSIREYK